ncbi:MAG: hypothetical protein AB8H86_15480 [Polyangiales bacterium]
MTTSMIPPRQMLGTLSLFLVLGCSCSEEVQLDDGGARDGGGSDSAEVDAVGNDAAGTDATGTDAGLPIDAAGVDGGRVDGGAADASTPPTIVMCQSQVYACGNTIDDDGDGLTDDQDPDCLGPCDNNEGGLFLDIPGGDSAPCRLDCYFDGDQGPGNDGCNWDHRCDPLEPDLICEYTDPPPASAMCPDVQDPECEDTCAPLVPNGCDCFGCCNLPAGGDRWVFIGSLNSDEEPTCTIDQAGDDEACHPCTPVDNCLNPCGECELCLGRTELPPSCFPPGADAGVADAGSDDAGSPDGGVPLPTCEDGRQLCGVPGAPSCPPGDYCLTGCCTFFN